MKLTKDNNFIGLMIGQIILIMVMPFLYYLSENAGKIILHSAVIGMILLTVIGNKKSTVWYKSFLILTGLEVIIFILSLVFDNVLYTYLAISLSLFFLVSSIFVAFKSVFFSSVISINQLVGASCIYLLLGIIGAILYSNLFFMFPESFSGLGNHKANLYFPDFLYYSYVTLTTLGFGDIVPVSPVAKTMSFMQAIVGQLYLTIMVAGLVGKTISNNMQSQ